MSPSTPNRGNSGADESGSCAVDTGIGSDENPVSLPSLTLSLFLRRAKSSARSSTQQSEGLRTLVRWDPSAFSSSLTVT